MFNRYKLKIEKDTQQHNGWLFLFVDDTIKEIEDSTNIFERASLKDLAIALFQQLFIIANDSLDNELIKEAIPNVKPPFNRLEFVSNKELKEKSSVLLDKLINGGKDYFNESYPLLLDMLNMRCLYFKNTVLDMAKRISSDKEKIAKELLDGGTFNSIEKLKLPSNDLHNLGKFPVIVTTCSGKFIYKPHNCNVDAWFYKFADKFFKDIIRVPKILSINDQYGYSKFIESYSADTIEKVKKYYYNMGGFLAILEALGSSDFHYENLLADNEYPVPVDFETIVEIGNQIVLNPLSINDKVCFDLPVIRKGILPLYLVSQKKDCSPLLNTDDDNVSMPVIDGKKIDVKEHIPCFIEGFKDTYIYCLNNKDSMKKEVDKMDDANIRSISIGSQTYFNMFKSLCKCENLKSIESRNKAISNYFEKIKIDPKLKGFVDSAVDGLINGDIPYHYAKADTRDVYYLDDVVLKDYLKESPKELITKNLYKLSLEDLSYELALIDKQFAYAAMKNYNYPDLEVDNNVPLFDSKLLHEELENIFDSIETSYIKNPEGKESWLVVSDKFETKTMNTELFQGTSGLAVFFANYIEVSLNNSKKQKAMYYLDICLNKEELSLDYYRKQIGNSNQILGLQGLGGSILAICIAYKVGKQKRYKELLSKEIDELKYIDFNSYDAVDAYSGLSGLLIVLCKNMDILDNKANDYINKIARRIIELRTLKYKDYLLWDSIKKERPVSGFGHGIIGIVEALTLAYEVTGNSEYLEVSKEAYKYEHDMYSEKLNTWPDFRKYSFAYENMHGICSGAPGIGNSILSINKEKNEFETYDEDLSKAKKACFEIINYRDHLCCGNGAIVDFLVNAYNATKQKDYLDKAYNIMIKMIDRKNTIGDYVLLPRDFKTNNNPALFFGVAGIGLEIVKLIKAIKKQDC